MILLVTQSAAENIVLYNYLVCSTTRAGLHKELKSALKAP